jgi:ABC-2 type transport system ATP-binding protein
VRQHIGLAGQFAAVDAHLTGRENLTMVGRLYNLGRREARRRADEVLHRIHLDDAGDRPVRTYSGGMRRRLDLAASMVGRPAVLFLDEPTTGVDPRSRLDIWQLIDELVDAGTTLLLTTQYLDEAERLADRIGVIDHGRLIAEGTADELKDHLGGDRVAVTVGAGAFEAAVGALAAFDGAMRTDAADGSMTIAAEHGTRDLLAVLRSLDAADIAPTSIELRRPSLDDVFMALTATEPTDHASSRGAPV